MRCSWRNSLVDRSKKHSGSYESRRIGRNVKPDAVQNWIGQTVFFAEPSFWLLPIKTVQDFSNNRPPLCNMRANPDISPRIRNLRCRWRNSLVDRSKSHSASYGLRRIGRNVKPDAVQNRIGQTVTTRKKLNHL